jgi:hypothetical protein
VGVEAAEKESVVPPQEEAGADTGAYVPRGSRAMVDLRLWDKAAFDKVTHIAPSEEDLRLASLQVRVFFGMTGVTGEEFYIREDFTDGTQRKKFQSGERDASNSKSVYFVPSSARNFMIGDRNKRLKIVSAGVKVLERSGKQAFAGGGECGYRLMQVIDASQRDAKLISSFTYLRALSPCLLGWRCSDGTIHPNTQSSSVYSRFL